MDPETIARAIAMGCCLFVLALAFAVLGWILGL
jgi:hypothetical protein